MVESWLLDKSRERERELIARMACSRDRAAEMGDGSEKLASNTREREREIVVNDL